MANQPLPRFPFRVEWGPARMSFTEITGLNIESEIIEYRIGNNPAFHKTKLQGLQKQGRITLKRGIAEADDTFFKWLNAYSESKKGKQDIIITLLNEDHKPVQKWRAKNAFPIKVTAPDLKANGNEVAIESIEIAHEGLELDCD